MHSLYGIWSEKFVRSLSTKSVSYIHRVDVNTTLSRGYLVVDFTVPEGYLLKSTGKSSCQDAPPRGRVSFLRCAVEDRCGESLEAQAGAPTLEGSRIWQLPFSRVIKLTLHWRVTRLTAPTGDRGDNALRWLDKAKSRRHRGLL